MKIKLVKLLALVLVVIMICFTSMGCGKNKEASNSDSKTVVDMTGNEVAIPKKVKKIFVDWTAGIILPMTLGATDKLVVAPTTFDEDAYAWTRMICPDIDLIEKNNEAYMSKEVALSYEPDVVITNMEENVAVYQSAGVDAVYVKFTDNKSFQEALKIVGEVLGDEEYEMAKKYCDYFDSNVQIVTERLENAAESSKPSVYYVDCRFADPYHTVGTGEVQEEWITTAGGVLATAEEFEGKNLEVTAEKIAEINPDIIMIGARNQADVYNTIMSDENFANLDAVKNNKVYRVPQGLSPWCRIGSEAAVQIFWAAKLLHPTEFEDIDVKAMVQEFYKEFYDAKVSDDALEGILAGKLSPTGN